MCPNNPNNVPRDILPEPFVADNYTCSQDALQHMPESLKLICLFLREGIKYYENEETYEEWFRNELSNSIQDLAVATRRPTLQDTGRLMSGLGPRLTQEAHRELFGLPEAEAKEIWDATKELAIPQISALYVCFSDNKFHSGTDRSLWRVLGGPGVG